jgi:hypothetical protein
MFSTNKEVCVEIDRELYTDVKNIAEAIEMTKEELGAFALKRLADEFEKTGTILLDAVHVAPAADEEGRNHPVTIHLDEVQRKVMSDAAETYGALLEQALKYGLFYFEKPLSPEERNGTQMLEEIKVLKNPDAYFEVRYEGEMINAQAEIEAAKEAEAEETDETKED